MLMCTDSFREPEQWTRQVVGQQSTWTRTAVISMDAYRQRKQSSSWTSICLRGSGLD
jgi:hypothetical protein